MGSPAWKFRKKEVTFFVVTSRESGVIVAREKIRARDYRRMDSYVRGIKRAYRRTLKKWPKSTHSIQIHIAMSEHPIAHWAG